MRNAVDTDHVISRLQTPGQLNFLVDNMIFLGYFLDDRDEELPWVGKGFEVENFGIGSDCSQEMAISN